MKYHASFVLGEEREMYTHVYTRADTAADLFATLYQPGDVIQLGACGLDESNGKMTITLSTPDADTLAHMVTFFTRMLSGLGGAQWAALSRRDLRIAIVCTSQECAESDGEGK